MTLMVIITMERQYRVEWCMGVANNYACHRQLYRACSCTFYTGSAISSHTFTPVQLCTFLNFLGKFLCLVSLLFLLSPGLSTVRLVTMSLAILLFHSFHGQLMIHCGMDSSVLVWRFPAVLIPTCHGSARHSVRPPLRILN